MKQCRTLYVYEIYFKDFYIKISNSIIVSNRSDRREAHRFLDYIAHSLHRKKRTGRRENSWRG